jgi:hypothetical protein
MVLTPTQGIHGAYLLVQAGPDARAQRRGGGVGRGGGGRVRLVQEEGGGSGPCS